MGFAWKLPSPGVEDHDYLVRGMVEVRNLSDAGWEIIKRQLTFENPAYRRAAMNGDDVSNLEPTILGYRESRGRRLFPRYFTSSDLNPGSILTVPPEAGGFTHKLLRAPLPKQHEIVARISALPVDADFGLELRCGTGKSFLALYAAAKRPGRILVVTPNESKRDEWIREILATFDMQSEQVGLIQASSRRWHDNPVSVAVLKTLAMQDFPDEVENAFSAVIWDEVHLTSAPVMSRALGKFNGRQIVLSATPGTGVRRKLIELHCGNNWLTSDMGDAPPVTIYFVRVKIPQWMHGKSWRWLKTKLAGNDHWNDVVVSLTRQAVHAGRRTIVLTSHIQPLVRTYNERIGNPGFVIGQDSLKKAALEQNELIQADVARVAGHLKGWKRQAAAYIEWVKDEANPILGTGLTKLMPAGIGMDVPDLNAGVITFPVGDADMTEQIVGRFMRPVNKEPPLLVVMVPNCDDGLGIAHKMERSAQAAGAMTIWNNDVM